MLVCVHSAFQLPTWVLIWLCAELGDVVIMRCACFAAALAMGVGGVWGLVAFYKPGARPLPWCREREPACPPSLGCVLTWAHACGRVSSVRRVWPLSDRRYHRRRLHPRPGHRRPRSRGARAHVLREVACRAPRVCDAALTTAVHAFPTSPFLAPGVRLLFTECRPGMRRLVRPLQPVHC